MKSFIERAILNSPAMNTLMIALLAVGTFSLFNLRREVFPEFELDIILVTVPYPGASPEEVEEGICQKIEEAVRAIDGIKKQTAVAKEGSGSVVLELNPGADAQRILNEVRSEVDRIPSFPLNAEDPEVKQITLRTEAIQVGVVLAEGAGREDEVHLRALAEEVRDDLLRLPSVSQAEIAGAKEYQIDVEIPEENLRRHGLTLQQAAQIIRERFLELPGGTIKTDAQEILVKGKNKEPTGERVEKVALVTEPVVLTVADLGLVRDEFVDVASYTRINGRPGLVISVERTANEDLLAITDEVHEYVKRKELPAGYELLTWADRSVEVRDRMDLLLTNGLQGLVLVLVILTLFLNARLAFWVAVGIPISILGACAVLYFAGHTLNMLTMFAFLMALGIVVDDAIVIGENVYTHRERGAGFVRAAIDGTFEVLPSVAASVATTVIAFTPMLFVAGVMGKFIAVLPLAMIAMLLISLFESTFVLPCHLAHAPHGDLFHAVLRLRARMHPALRWTLGALLVGLAWVVAQLAYPFARLGALVKWLNAQTDRALQYVAGRVYIPLLARSLANPAVVLSIALVLLLVTGGLIRSGVVPFVVFPKLDNNTLQAEVSFPDGTPASVTDEATRKMEAAIRKLNEKYAEDGQPILRLTQRSVGQVPLQGGLPGQTAMASGSHFGLVIAELVDTERRGVHSDQIVREWRALAGEFPGAEGVKFGARMMGPGGTPIEFKLLARPGDEEKLEKAVEETKARLARTPGVFDISDDARPGKWEFQIKVKEDARTLGTPLADVAQTVRASYYGEEVMRLQRGRHEIKVMVRYPREQRRSLADLHEIRVQSADGVKRPITELVDIDIRRGYSEINRVDALRSITITADVDEAVAESAVITRSLQTEFLPELFEKYPGLYVRWEGQAEQTRESVQSLIVGLAIAVLAMFVVLTLEFRAYLQPLLILAAIPFGAVGAVFGHALLGLPITMFSLFGFVALTGVVVNDSIVLIDFINLRVRDGVPLGEALVDAGRRRLRPILLTSLTTIGGLLPLLLETSFQAQILIPMAVSLCGGLMLTTLLILFLVPTFYLLYARLTGSDGVAEKVEGYSSPEPEMEKEREPAVLPGGNGQANEMAEVAEVIRDPAGRK